MGKQAHCVARFNDRPSEGVAQLETDHFLFRGEFRLRIPIKQLFSVVAADGLLELTWPEGHAEFDLGPAAQKWAHELNNPKTMLDKLGVKGGMKASVLGFDDGFAAELARRNLDVSLRRRRNCDLVFLAVESRADLSRLKDLERYIKQDGAIWIVSPKGRPDLVKEGEIYETARGFGLTDVKVVRFSDTHTANKFVIPRSRRR